MGGLGDMLELGDDEKAYHESNIFRTYKHESEGDTPLWTSNEMALLIDCKMNH